VPVVVCDEGGTVQPQKSCAWTRQLTTVCVVLVFSSYSDSTHVCAEHQSHMPDFFCFFTSLNLPRDCGRGNGNAC
jgi:hypothetical protein